MRYCLLFLLSLVIISFPVSAQKNELFFTILYTNDEHSAILPHSPAVDFDIKAEDPTIGGFARLATAVNEIRSQKFKKSEPVILVSAGDFTGGTPFAWLIAEGFPVEITLMQKIGYDVVTLGNHEFDFTSKKLATYLINAGYPEKNNKTAIVATNLIVEKENPLKGILKRFHIIELENGLRIGFIGILGKDAQKKAFSHEGIQFEDPVESARNAIETLKKLDVDVIVAISHSGLSEDLELAKKAPEIDIIIGGHCHSVLEKPLITQDGTIIVQAGHSLRYLGILELSFRVEDGKIRIRNDETRTPFLIEINDLFAVDMEVDSLIKEYTEKLNSMIYNSTGGRYRSILDTVAFSDFELKNEQLSESNIGNFITDAMRIIVEKKTGEKVDFAMFANGEIRGNVTPGKMEHSKGRISLYDLLIPVSLGMGSDGSPGYSLVLVYITGEELHRLLEIVVLLQEIYGDDYFIQFSGLRYYYNPQNVLLIIPLIDKKIPTVLLPFGGAVVKVEKFVGTGLQSSRSEDYVPVARDKQLYSLVLDNYILSFLPKVAEVLPALEIIPKDKEGKPVPKERFDELTIKVNGSELKVWQVVVEFAFLQPVDTEGIPKIDKYYSAKTGRINTMWTFPTIGYLLAAVFGVTVLLVLVKVKRSRRS